MRSPAQRTAGKSAETTMNAANVPSPPSTAKSGTSSSPMRRFMGARNGLAPDRASRPAGAALMTDACAIVNESIAPKA